MTEIYTVMRPLPYGLTTLPTGSVVNAATWRNLEKLLTQRYLRPATAEEIVALSDNSEADMKPKPKPKREAVNA